MDVTRCKIIKPRLDPHHCFSAKDGFHALKYEIACSFLPPYHIIWFNGPYKGAVADITIYRHRLKYMMQEDEYMLADKGYIGASKLITPVRSPETADELRLNSKVCRVRQHIERINKRIKDWRLAASCWRSFNYGSHQLCMSVICKLVNEMLVEEPLSK